MNRHARRSIQAKIRKSGSDVQVALQKLKGLETLPGMTQELTEALSVVQEARDFVASVSAEHDEIMRKIDRLEYAMSVMLGNEAYRNLLEEYDRTHSEPDEGPTKEET